MPFITEEIWQSLPHNGESIMISDYPIFYNSMYFKREEAEFEKIMTCIKAIRNRRAEMNVPPSKKSHVYISTECFDTFDLGRKFIKKLAYASEVHVYDDFETDDAVSIITSDAKIEIPMADLLDLDAELLRLNKEKQAAVKEFEFINGKLSNENFVNKAPPNIVQEQRKVAFKLSEKIALLDKSIDAIEK
jgi:valyl-tRNA synthetase